MAKSELRIKARELRSQGQSVKEIARNLKIARSSVSLWTRDIILSIEQMEKLHQRVIVGSERGRILGALNQKKKRLEKIKKYRQIGIKTFSQMSDKEFLAAGVALYWAEGTKKRRVIQIVNSDPKMINFMIKWMVKFFGIKKSELYAHVGINAMHTHRDLEIKAYWSKITTLPLEQFRKTSFKKVENKKIYDNNDQYFGTLDVRVIKSARFYYKIIGLIEGLSEAT